VCVVILAVESGSCLTELPKILSPEGLTARFQREPGVAVMFQVL